MLQEKIESLKRVDFKLFFVTLRFALSCYQMIIWLYDEVYEFYQNDGGEDLSFPVERSDNIELTKFKTFLEM